jgi:hypothetical protein
MTIESLTAKLRNGLAYQRLLEDLEDLLEIGWLTDEQIRHLVAVLQRDRETDR